MSNLSPEDLSLNLVAEVDFVVMGATSSAVAFALSAREAGVSVFVVSSRPYLGEDICALYRYWPEYPARDGLAASVFTDPGNPPRPMHVKLTLEQALVRAGIPFLFNSFPAGLLRTQSGTIQGVAIANRTGLQAIRARCVIDATLDALVMRQAGYSGAVSPAGEQDVEYVTLCEGNGCDASGVEEVERLPGYHTNDYVLSARRYRLRVNFGDGSPKALADAYSDAIEQCWVPQEYRHQARILPCQRTSVVEPEQAQLECETGLYGLTESMQLSQGAAGAFADPVRAMTIAGKLGMALTTCLPEKNNETLSVVCAGSQPLPCGVLRTHSEALRPSQSDGTSVSFNANKLPKLGAFDVVVVGGGTGGAPAAISAARADASTLVIELSSGLGGVGTLGQIAKYWYGNRVGFTAEIDAGVNDLEYKSELREANDRWSVSAKSEWFHRVGRQAGCTYWFNTLCVGVCVDGGRVKGLLVAGPYGYGLVETGCVVDSTGCSDVPAMAGAPTALIGAEHVAVQGTGLAGQMPGREYQNSDHNFSDDTDIVDATAILTSAKVKFRDEFDCGELVDSRERRQIVGDYAIRAVDILYEHRFEDTVCVASSNFDSHGFTVDPVFMIKPADKRVRLWADIPLRCLLPRGLDGVLVTGLGISAHRDGLPVIRMQADVQNQGYATGMIAALSAKAKAPIRSLAIGDIQEKLIAVGNLPARVLNDHDNFPVSESQIETAVREGWDELAGIALILHDGQRSLPVLKQAYASLHGERSAQSLRYAQMMAFLGCADGQAELLEVLAERSWDEGWRFRGMHQFGMTVSEVDLLLICVGRVGDIDAWPVVFQKMRTLADDAEFSHFRAVAMGCESLYARCPSAESVRELARLLQRPGYRGHAHRDIEQVQQALTADINENTVRDHALRELHLARALYRCGDAEGLGRRVLTEYAQDRRGHFARHAQAVLEESSWRAEPQSAMG